MPTSAVITGMRGAKAAVSPQRRSPPCIIHFQVPEALQKLDDALPTHRIRKAKHTQAIEPDKLEERNKIKKTIEKRTKEKHSEHEAKWMDYCTQRGKAGTPIKQNRGTKTKQTKPNSRQSRSHAGVEAAANMGPECSYL